MFNEIWRGAGIPSELGPPAGSYLSACFRRHEFGHRFQNLMNFDNVTRWIANRHDKIMLEEKQIALERDYQEMGSRLHALEREYQETGSRLHALEQRLEQSDASHRVLAENRIALEQRCREVESDYHLLAERFRQLEASHQAVLASTSWRLTEPLRGLGRSLRALDRGKVPDGRS
jgi:septal ring factor EnvC (AmiA/AmiB activator)